MARLRTIVLSQPWRSNRLYCFPSALFGLHCKGLYALVYIRQPYRQHPQCECPFTPTTTALTTVVTHALRSFTFPRFLFYGFPFLWVSKLRNVLLDGSPLDDAHADYFVELSKCLSQELGAFFFSYHLIALKIRPLKTRCTVFKLPQ